MAERGWGPWQAVLCGVGVLGLVACGGVDTGGDASAGQVTSPAVVISQTNAARVATEALQAVAVNLASVRASEGSSAASAAGSAGALSSRQAVVAMALRKAGGITAQATAQKQFNCSGGGSVVVTLTAAAVAVLTPGDTLDFAFSFCKEGDVITNGALKLRLVSFDSAGTGGTLEVYDTVATNLDQTAGGVLERQNGSVRLSLDDRLIGERLAGQLDIAATSATSSIERRIGGSSRTTRSIQDLSLSRIDVQTTQRSVSFVSFTASGPFPALDDVSFKVDTITAIVIPAGTFQPTSGELKITGANNSNIIIRIGADTVALEIDVDGNGVAEATVQRTWAQVFADR